MNNAPLLFLQYKLLLYLSQQKQVTAAKIHVGFVFTVSRDIKDVYGETDDISLHTDGSCICLKTETFLRIKMRLNRRKFNAVRSWDFILLQIISKVMLLVWLLYSPTLSIYSTFYCKNKWQKSRKVFLKIWRFTVKSAFLKCLLKFFILFSIFLMSVGALLFVFVYIYVSKSPPSYIE